MNKLAATIMEKKVKETASAVAQAAEEIVTMSKKTFALEIAVAVLGGIVLGMFLSPRKKVSYKIASNNRINTEHDEDGDEDEEEDADSDDDNDEDEDDDEIPDNGKFIKL